MNMQFRRCFCHITSPCFWWSMLLLLYLLLMMMNEIVLAPRPTRTRGSPPAPRTNSRGGGGHPAPPSRRSPPPSRKVPTRPSPSRLTKRPGPSSQLRPGPRPALSRLHLPPSMLHLPPSMMPPSMQLPSGGGAPWSRMPMPPSMMSSGGGADPTMMGSMDMPFYMDNGFEVDELMGGGGTGGFHLVPMDGQNAEDVPSHFIVSSDPSAGSGHIRIDQWTNSWLPPGSFRFAIPSGFRVSLTNAGRFQLRGPMPREQVFSVPASSFRVSHDTNPDQITITVSVGGGSTAMQQQQQQTVQRQLPQQQQSWASPNRAMSAASNTQQQQQQQMTMMKRDKTKADGSTDCGPRIAHKCIEPLYAKLMEDQCPETCSQYKMQQQQMRG